LTDEDKDFDRPNIETALFVHWKEAKNVTYKFVSIPPYKIRKIFAEQRQEKKKFSNKIFIVYGRDDKPKLELARLLEKELKLEAIILSEQTSEGRTIIENIEKYSDVGFAFIILTPDDIGYLDVGSAHNNSIPKKRARQNVIFEFGFFVGKLGRNRVCCLYKEGVEELPSDINGILYKFFHDSVMECYSDIVKELKAAGYDFIN
jgi:predicted nucleotide-binding protein